MEPYLRTVFLERLAHDLRGATSIGVGALDQLTEQLRGTDGESFSKIARRSLARVLRISTSLSEAAELERGGVTLTLADADLLEMARAAAEGARALENRRGIELTVAGAGRARCDEGRIKRAIFELVSNAIRLAHTQARVDVRVEGGRAIITVDDDGPGCPPAAARFTPTTERRGLGLGLPMAVEIAALHGGSLDISRKSEFTAVSISFPAM